MSSTDTALCGCVELCSITQSGFSTLCRNPLGFTRAVDCSEIAIELCSLRKFLGIRTDRGNVPIIVAYLHRELSVISE